MKGCKMEKETSIEDIKKYVQESLSIKETDAWFDEYVEVAVYDLFQRQILIETVRERTNIWLINFDNNLLNWMKNKYAIKYFDEIVKDEKVEDFDDFVGVMQIAANSFIDDVYDVVEERLREFSLIDKKYLTYSDDRA